MQTLPDFLIIGQEDWDEIWRRNQFLIAGLARRFPATKFLYIELPCDLTYGLRSGQIWHSNSPVWRKWREVRAGLRPCETAPNIKLLTLPKFSPFSWPGGLQAYNLVAAKVIRRALQNWGIERPLAWTQSPIAASLLGKLETRAIIYDNTDDWTLAGFGGKAQQQIEAGDRYFTNHADLVLTCSPFLTKQKQVAGANVAYVRNGVDLKLYQSQPEAKIIEPVLKDLPRPILGYTGSLHAGRLDLALLKKLADSRPEWSLVLVGPNFLPPAETLDLQSRANLHLTGSRPFKTLPALISQFDLLILPHLVTTFTESLDPIKVYEYLATGKPIVAAPVAGVRDYPGLIYLANSVDEFIFQVEAALAEPANLRTARCEAAKQHDWEDRLDQVISHLAEVLSDSTAPVLTLLEK